MQGLASAQVASSAALSQLGGRLGTPQTGAAVSRGPAAHRYPPSADCSPGGRHAPTARTAPQQTAMLLTAKACTARVCQQRCAGCGCCCAAVQCATALRGGRHPARCCHRTASLATVGQMCPHGAPLPQRPRPCHRHHGCPAPGPVGARRRSPTTVPLPGGARTPARWQRRPRPRSARRWRLLPSPAHGMRQLGHSHTAWQRGSTHRMLRTACSGSSRRRRGSIGRWMWCLLPMTQSWPLCETT